MPYIKPERRRDLKDSDGPKNSGELNYLIHKAIDIYLKCPTTPDMSYEMVERIVGCLEMVKQEFVYRIGHPYEDKKRFQNGDVEPYISIIQSGFNRYDNRT